MKIKFKIILSAIIWIGTSYAEKGQMAPTMDYDSSATCLSGKIKVYLKYSYSTYRIEVIGQTTGWIGIGFSISGSMAGADIVVGWVKSGQVTITDREAIANGLPTLKREQKLTILNGSELNGLTRLKFSAPYASFSFYTDPAPLVCAYGNDDPTGNDIRESDYHGTDNREFTCLQNGFLCEDRSKCVFSYVFCDNSIDCRDGSDEYIYEMHESGRECDGRDHRSSNKRCLLREKYVCDGNIDCVDEFDELMCDQPSETGYLNSEWFRCLRNPSQIIPIIQLCNGVFDCMDLTDECICDRSKRPTVCSSINILFDSQVSQSFVCENKNSSSYDELDINKICDNVNNCENGIDEKNCNEVQCSVATPPPFIADVLRRGKGISGFHKCGYKCPRQEKYATRCDGVFECDYSVHEECDYGYRTCKNPSKICNYKYDKGKFECTNKDGKLKYVTRYNLCNGIQDCSDGFDELDCRGRFYCTNGSTINIPIKQKCDQRKDCDDGSDEFNCSFHCKDSGTKELIDSNKVCDGTFDCKFGRDECISKCITSAFSSVESLIASRVLLGPIWILSLLAFFGNFSVVVFSIREFLRFKKRDGVVRKINKSLVFNLSLSDLLVGVYLVSICIKNAINEGEYCFVDRDWRSGIKCSALGTVLLVGSEQSVFTITIITGVRLYTVVRPLERINVRLIIILVALSWIISLAAANIPHIPQTQDYFVDNIRYQDNQLFSIIKHEDVEYYTKWLLLTNKYANESEHFGVIGSWALLEHLIEKLNNNYTVHGKFGYYSKHGVCVAPLFPNPQKHTSWIYTFVILIVNFLAFFFICAGYVAIYCITKKQKRRIQKKPDVNMQKKITRIVVTDFFCWMPVCIMGMIQVSGIKIPNDAYVFVGMILIPINSALNPFLYSDIPEYLGKGVDWLRAWIYRHCTTLKNRVINSRRRSNEAQHDTPVETIEMRVVEEVEN